MRIDNFKHWLENFQRFCYLINRNKKNQWLFKDSFNKGEEEKMCQLCDYNKFWIVRGYVDWQDFEKQQEIYQKLILNKAKVITARSIYASDPLISKVQAVVYQFNKNCLALSIQASVKARQDVIIKGHYFWDHKIFAGLYLFGSSSDGKSFERSRILENLGRTMSDILLNKIC